MKKVIIYTTAYCPYCHAAKALLNKKKIPFEEIDVSDDEEFDALVKKTGWKTVPQIFVGKKLIGGYQELVKLDQKGNLNEILKSYTVESQD